MLDQRREWCRSLLAALVTVTTSAVLMAQPQTRIGNRVTDFGDVNRMIEQGSERSGNFNYSNPQLSSQSQADLSGIDIRVVRNLLRESVLESERLYKSMETDWRRSPEIRPLLSDLITMRARASRIAQDVDSQIALERLLPQFKQLDSDWRLLSHQISLTRQVSNASRDSAQRIDRLGRELEKLFQMEPQLDRRALTSELANLASASRNLVQELEMDPNGGASINSLILDARKLDQQAYRVQTLVYDSTNYSSIVSEYNRFVTMWDAMSPQLRRLNNRFVDRIVGNIVQSDSQLHNLLWLEQQTSNENLRLIADGLMRDVDEFFNRVPLKLLMHFKDANRILQTANDFYGTVQNFQDCVKRNENETRMLECYRYVEEYGNDFVRAFEPLRSQAGKVVLREIEDGVVALRSELNLAGTVTSVDTRALLTTAAGLENLADHLDFDVRQWLTRERPTYSSEAQRASANFLQRAQSLHRMLQGRPSTNELKTATSDLAEEFRRVYQYLGRCRTEHRDHLRILSEDISQAIYELRVPLQL